MRIQVILTVLVITSNLIGIAVVGLMVTVVFPVPNVFGPDARWITFTVVPAYVAAALVIGTFWATHRVVEVVEVGDRGTTADAHWVSATPCWHRGD